ncbi:MAG TPA: hypothetical protein VI432_00720 [Candidatus Paceibacterota bacterium]
MEFFKGLFEELKDVGESLIPILKSLGSIFAKVLDFFANLIRSLIT